MKISRLIFFLFKIVLLGTYFSNATIFRHFWKSHFGGSDPVYDPPDKINVVILNIFIFYFGQNGI